MQKIGLEPDTGHRMTIWRMRIACWIHKATNTHSEYVMLIAFPIRQWLYGRVSTYIACVVMRHCLWVAASSTYLMYFNTMFFSPSTTMSRPVISKPASAAFTSVTCSGSSTGMLYFFKPANSNCHHNRSEIRRHLLIYVGGLWGTPNCLRLSFSNNWSYSTKFGTHVIKVEVTPNYSTV